MHRLSLLLVLLLFLLFLLLLLQLVLLLFFSPPPPSHLLLLLLLLHLLALLTVFVLYRRMKRSGRLSSLIASRVTLRETLTFGTSLFLRESAIDRDNIPSQCVRT